MKVGAQRGDKPFGRSLFVQARAPKGYRASVLSPENVGLL